MEYIKTLRTAITDAVPKLKAISAEKAARKPQADKWSIQQIIGHLVDSAANNHQRFVRANLQDDFLFLGYQQAAWVEIQDYQNYNWERLIDFWALYNYHIADLMERIPQSVRLKKHKLHNLHQIGMRPVLSTDLVTLDFLMDDYVFHLQHHLNQIFSNEHQ